MADPKIPFVSEVESEGAVVVGAGGTDRGARLSFRLSRGAGGG